MFKKVQERRNLCVDLKRIGEYWLRELLVPDWESQRVAYGSFGNCGLAA